MKKGFTLVELVAVVVLLGILLLFSYTKISDIAEKKNNELLENKKSLVINALKEYINDNDDITENIGDVHCISIEDLEDENLIPVNIDDLKEKYNYVRVVIGKKNSYSFVNDPSDEDCNIK